MAWKEDSIDWQTIRDIFDEHSLWGEKGISHNDVNQGSMGNCWFLAGASAMAEDPGRLEKIFLNNVNEISPKTSHTKLFIFFVLLSL